MGRRGVAPASDTEVVDVDEKRSRRHAAGRHCPGLSSADLILGGWLFDLAIVLLVLAATGAVMGGFCYLAGVEAGKVTEDASLSRIRRGGLVRTQAAARLTRPLFSLSLVVGLLGLVILLLVALTR